jgi:hypothetical protein
MRDQDQQPELPFDNDDDPKFARWERQTRHQREELQAPLDRLRQRLAERQTAATEAPKDQDPDEDLDVDEDGQGYPF